MTRRAREIARSTCCRRRSRVSGRRAVSSCRFVATACRYMARGSQLVSGGRMSCRHRAGAPQQRVCSPGHTLGVLYSRVCCSDGDHGRGRWPREMGVSASVGSTALVLRGGTESNWRCRAHAGNVAKLKRVLLTRVRHMETFDEHKGTGRSAILKVSNRATKEPQFARVQAAAPVERPRGKAAVERSYRGSVRT